MELREKKREKGVVSRSNKGLTLLFLVFILLCSLSFLTCATKCLHFGNKDRRSVRMRPSPYIIENSGGNLIRRRLSAGPGSYPPRCSYKCGNCAPCSPVHVPVPPGTMFVPTEYYPEAWRCKCGNRLYMP